jgi:hypothetical protein
MSVPVMMVTSFIWLRSERLVYLSSFLKEVADEDSVLFIVESLG